MADRLILFDNAFSPYAFKVRATLYEKEIEHEKREMRHAADRSELLAINPRGEVPAIVHGKALVYDSSVICEYLETVFPKKPLLPGSPSGQARCRLLERLADGPLDGAVIVLAIVKMLRPKLQNEYPEVVERAQRQIAALYAYLDSQLPKAGYLCGRFSRAELALAPQLAGAAFLGSPPEGQRLSRWFERVSLRPSVQRATAEFMEGFRASQEDADPFFHREQMHVRDHRIEWCLRLGLGPWLNAENEAGRLLFSPIP